MILPESKLLKRKIIIAGLILSDQVTWKKVKQLLTHALLVKKAKIVVFPEHTLDLISSNSNIPVHAILDNLLRVSSRFQVSIIPGTYNKGGTPTCPVISKGNIEGEVRKQTISRNGAINCVKTELSVFNIEGLKTCILICRDIERYQVKEKVIGISTKVELNLIINPAAIIMKNPLIITKSKDFEIAWQMACDNLLQFMNKVKCNLVRVDWAQSIDQGCMGTSLAINSKEEVTLPDQRAEMFIFKV